MDSLQEVDTPYPLVPSQTPYDYV